MGIDLDSFRNRRKQAQARQGGDRQELFKFPDGRTLFYLLPPTSRMDPAYPFLDLILHWNLGPKNLVAACLEPENEILKDPATLAALVGRKQKLDLSGPCPIEELLLSDAPGLDEEALDRMKAKTDYLMAVIPWARINNGVVIPLSEAERIPVPARGGYKIWSGICDVIERAGDVTDPDNAILIECHKTGKGLNTDYSMSVDVASLKEPFRLPKSQRAAMRKAQEEHGTCDLHRVVASFVRGRSELEAILGGSVVETRQEPEEAQRPHCYADPEAIDGEDVECRACPVKVECSAECEVETPPDIEERAPRRTAAVSRPTPSTRSPAPRQTASLPPRKTGPPPDDDPDDGDEALRRAERRGAPPARQAAAVEPRKPAAQAPERKAPPRRQAEAEVEEVEEELDEETSEEAPEWDEELTSETSGEDGEGSSEEEPPPPAKDRKTFDDFRNTIKNRKGRNVRS